MYKQVEFFIKGISPTLLHSGRLANPLDPIAKEMKRFSSKRKKTDEDHRTLSDLEWLGSFYPSQPGEFEVKGNNVAVRGFGVPIWPGENIERMLVEAAKRKRLGTQFKAGVMVDGEFEINYDGPKTIEALFGDERFRDIRRAKVQNSAVMRTRPIFRDWSLRFVVSYLADLVNEQDVVEAVETAGQQIGLSDHRPKFGRFVLA